jgi:hypothetical protein
MATDHRNWFHADLPLLWSDVREDKLPHQLRIVGSQSGPVRRYEFAERLR